MVGIPREEKRGGITTVVWEKDSVPRKLVLKSVPEREREREREEGLLIMERTKLDGW